jgi:hypothetical protein
MPPHNGLPSQVPTTPQAQIASGYSRQSSLPQGTRQTRSPALQDRLVARVRALGWPPDRGQIIADDRGKSGASTDQRLGCQRLRADMGVARVGLVTRGDASR